MFGEGKDIGGIALIAPMVSTALTESEITVLAKLASLGKIVNNLK